MKPTAERLRELLDYDPETGIFIWKVSRRNALAGTPAGCIGNKGYRQIKIDGRIHLAHCLAWLYVHGVWPPRQIDHQDTIKDHNCIGNLRLATGTQNKGNSPRSRTNRSGLKGVCHSRGKWLATIRYEGRSINLGRFDTPEAAHSAYIAAARKLFGEFARGE